MLSLKWTLLCLIFDGCKYITRHCLERWGSGNFHFLQENVYVYIFAVVPSLCRGTPILPCSKTECLTTKVWHCWPSGNWCGLHVGFMWLNVYHLPSGEKKLYADSKPADTLIIIIVVVINICWAHYVEPNIRGGLCHAWRLWERIWKILP